MKRRIKFVTSVASLTLAMVLMMAGVWAAATRQVAISGTLSFTGSNVEATVTVYQSTSATFTLPATNIAIVGTATTFTGATQTGADVALTPALSDTVTKYTFVVKIEGKFPAGSASNIAVDVTVPTAPAQAWLTLTHSGAATAPTAAATGTTAADVASINGITGVYYYTFTYTANPATAPASASGIAFTASVSLTRAN